MKFKLIATTLLPLLLFTACDSDLMSAVKSSQYGKTTIEDIFEDTDYCSDVTWTDKKIRGKEAVKVVCTVDTDDFMAWGPKLVYQFVKKNNTASWYNTYWSDEQGNMQNSLLAEEQAFFLLDILNTDGVDYAK